MHHPRPTLPPWSAILRRYDRLDRAKPVPDPASLNITAFLCDVTQTKPRPFPARGLGWIRGDKGWRLTRLESDQCEGDGVREQEVVGGLQQTVPGKATWKGSRGCVLSAG